MNNRPWLNVQPDKKYGLGYVDSRCELPYDFPPVPELLEVAMAQTVQKTIDDMTRLSHWQHYDKMPITYSISGAPTRKELDYFNSLKRGEKGRAVPSGLTAVKESIVVVARIWFIQELVQVNMDEQAELSKIGEEAGFVAPEDMPEGSLL